MTTSARWDDLAVRMASGTALAAVGALVLWAGGLSLTLFACLAAGVMTWEAAAMTAPARRTEAFALAALAAGGLALIVFSHDPKLIPLLLAPAVAGALRARSDRAGFFAVAAAVSVAAYAVIAYRETMGLAFVLWIVAVVAAVDLLGYFGGRLIGGPKVWPRLSPKKTWSGTLAGWAGAAAVGAGFVAAGLAPAWAIPFSALAGLAAQMGDIGESAVKRRAGVKDASRIIPGHGGLMDRFDGLSGALLFLILWGLVLPLPAVGG
ncbi:MAG: phosphatidate cytidylyltransferase [Paracoccaceae bacterium]